MTSPGSGSISSLACKRRLRNPLLFSGKLNLSSRQPDNEAEESQRKRRGHGEKFHISTFAKTFALFCLLGVYCIETSQSKSIDKTKYTTLLAPAAPSAPASFVVKSELVQQQQDQSPPPTSIEFVLNPKAPPPEGANYNDELSKIFARILRDTNSTHFFQTLPLVGASGFEGGNELMAALLALAAPSMNKTLFNSTRPLALALSTTREVSFGGDPEPTPTLNQIETGDELDRKLSIQVSAGGDRQLPAISLHQVPAISAEPLAPEPETQVVEEATAEPEVAEYPENDEQLQQDEPRLTALFPPPIDTAPEGTLTVKGHLVDKFGTAIGGGLIDETFSSRPFSAFE